MMDDRSVCIRSGDIMHLDRNNGDVLILFYQNLGYYGGIQSIILRLLAKAKLDDSPIILVCSTEILVPELEGINVLEITKSAEETAKSILFLNEADSAHFNILAFAPYSGALGFEVALKLKALSPSSIVQFAVGVFHPRDFFRENEKLHLHVLNFLLGRCIGLERLYFMNEACRTSHEKFFRRKLSSNAIVPVPLDRRESQWFPKLPKKVLRVISVGRIVPFKAYNFAIPKLVAELLGRGLNVHWDIFGYGTHEVKLKNEIDNYDVQSNVKFRGPLNFSDFDGIVSQYDVFVGIGTAAAQASQLGVPTILAIDNEPDDCYGYIFEVPFGLLGEKNNSLLRYKILDIIVQFVDASRIDQEHISARCKNSVLRYEIDDYTSSIFLNREIYRGKKTFLAGIFCAFYDWSNRPNFIRRLLWQLKAISGHRKPQD